MKAICENPQSLNLFSEHFIIRAGIYHFVVSITIYNVLVHTKDPLVFISR